MAGNRDIFLVVKGTPEDMYTRAETHGITLCDVRGLPQSPYTETVGYAAYWNLSDVIAWFAEDSDAPFEPGTLLWFRDVHRR